MQAKKHLAVSLLESSNPIKRVEPQSECCVTAVITQDSNTMNLQIHLKLHPFINCPCHPAAPDPFPHSGSGFTRAGSICLSFKVCIIKRLYVYLVMLNIWLLYCSDGRVFVYSNAQQHHYTSCEIINITSLNGK